MRILLLILLTVACAHPPKYGDVHLRKKEVPSFLQAYESHHKVAFYKKTKPHQGATFEVKYEDLKDHEISLTFSPEGVLLEREEDIAFREIPRPVWNKIETYLEREYSGYKKHEAEKREDALGKKYYDLEIKHKTSHEGYWELSFDEEGYYVSRKAENYDPIETLN